MSAVRALKVSRIHIQRSCCTNPGSCRNDSNDNKYDPYYRGHFNSTSIEYVTNPDQDFFVKVPKWSREKFNVFV